MPAFISGYAFGVGESFFCYYFVGVIAYLNNSIYGNAMIFSRIGAEAECSTKIDCFRVIFFWIKHYCYCILTVFNAKVFLYFY